MSIADEIRKLKELLDAGVLSADEFEQAKKIAISGSTQSATPISAETERLRQQLDKFKSAIDSNAVEYEDELAALLDGAEDMLIAVCGRDRYDAFRATEREINDAGNMIRQCRKDRDDEGRREWQKTLDKLIASLVNRVKGLEVRG